MFANLANARRLRPAMIGRAAVGVFMIGHLIAGSTGPSPSELGRAASITTVAPAGTAGTAGEQAAPGQTAASGGNAAAGAKAGNGSAGTTGTTGAAPSPSASAAPDKPAAPPESDLIPQGTQGEQVGATLSTGQVQNAKAIVDTGKDLKLPPRAEVIAVATSLQETKLNNYGDLGADNDHDSLGLFQQRPSAGWGNPDQLTDPKYAATQFYKALEQVPGWQSLPLTVAAQTVQVSAFPDAYAKWEKQAADLVLATYGTGPYADQAK
jgi:hypothetical protein